MDIRKVKIKAEIRGGESAISKNKSERGGCVSLLKKSWLNSHRIWVKSQFCFERNQREAPREEKRLSKPLSTSWGKVGGVWRTKHARGKEGAKKSGVLRQY